MKNLITITFLFLFTLTAFGQTEDSVKFSGLETRALLRAWENEPKYVQVTDSLQKVVERDSVIIYGDSVLIFDAKDLLRAKNETINALGELSESYKDSANREARRKKFWRGTTFITGGAAAGVIIYQILNK